MRNVMKLHNEMMASVSPDSSPERPFLTALTPTQQKHHSYQFRFKIMPNGGNKLGLSCQFNHNTAVGARERMASLYGPVRGLSLGLTLLRVWTNLGRGLGGPGGKYFPRSFGWFNLEGNSV